MFKIENSFRKKFKELLLEHGGLHDLRDDDVLIPLRCHKIAQQLC